MDRETWWAIVHRVAKSQTPLKQLPGKNTGVGCHALLQGGLSDPEIESVSLTSPAGRFITNSASIGALILRMWIS